MRNRLFTYLLFIGLVAFSRPAMTQLIVDDFKVTTFGNPIYTVNFAVPNNSTLTAFYDTSDTSSGLGGSRYIASAEALACAADGLITGASIIGMTGHSFVDSVTVSLNSGTATGDAIRSIFWGISNTTIQSKVGTTPIAEVSVVANPNVASRANIHAYNAVKLDFAFVSPSVLTMPFRITGLDTSGNAFESSQYLTTSGANVSLLFPFASFNPSGANGVFGASATSMFDDQNLSSLGLDYHVQPQWSLELNKVSFVSTAAPEASSLSLLAGGGLALAFGMLRRRRK